MNLRNFCRRAVYAPIIATLVFSTLSVGAAPEPDAAPELQAQARHARAGAALTRLITQNHYRSKPLDDALSEQILDYYLDGLDLNRSYFTAADMEGFEQYRYRLDDSLLTQDFAPAFAIFEVYRQRVTERVAHAKLALEQQQDFSIDEEYRFDRRDAAWAQSRTELDERWRKRVKNDYLLLKLEEKTAAEIIEILSARYTRLEKRVFQFNANDVFQAFINAYTATIEPHTSYFSPRSSENFDINMRLSLEGIGAVLRTEDDYTVVQRVIPGGPAELSGQLQVEDRIVGVGQGNDGAVTDVVGWRLEDVVDLIRGPKGSVVRLAIRPDTAGLTGANKTIALVRDKIKLEEQAVQWKTIDTDDGLNLGILEIPTFYSDIAAKTRGEPDYRSTSRDVRKLLTDAAAQQVDGLIIDLRGNGGGALAEALEFTGMFIKSGPVVQTRDATGKIRINYDSDKEVVYGGPLAVLVDRNSASASEIFAGAMQDYRRGIIIGEPTFGKATVQSVVDLDELIENNEERHGHIKTTVAQFFRVSGASNQYRGIIPDIIFPTARYAEEHGERALDNALLWDSIKPTRYMPATAPVVRFNEVRTRHEARVQENRLIQLLLEEMELDRRQGERKTTTLLESKRKSERAARSNARKQIYDEYRAALGLEPADEETEDATTIEDAFVEALSESDPLLEETSLILADLITLR